MKGTVGSGCLFHFSMIYQCLVPSLFHCEARAVARLDSSVRFLCCRPAEGGKLELDGAMEPPENIEGRSFVEVMSEKYSPENFPYRRGPGMGVVVVPTAGPQGSPMKGELKINLNFKIQHS